MKLALHSTHNLGPKRDGESPTSRRSITLTETWDGRRRAGGRDIDLGEAGPTVATTPLPHGQTAEDTNREEPEGTAEAGQSEVLTENTNLRK